MRWSWKWRKELESGFYYRLLADGYILEEDQEPGTQGFDFYFDAFRELSTSRPIGLSVGPIPFTAISDYFKIYELHDFDEFLYVMRRLDNVFLELNSTSTKSEGAPKSGTDNAGKKNHRKRRR